MRKRPGLLKIYATSPKIHAAANCGFAKPIIIFVFTPRTCISQLSTVKWMVELVGTIQKKVNTNRIVQFNHLPIQVFNGLLRQATKKGRPSF